MRVFSNISFIHVHIEWNWIWSDLVKELEKWKRDNATSSGINVIKACHHHFYGANLTYYYTIHQPTTHCRPHIEADDEKKNSFFHFDKHSTT